jgi:hypothetical protein
MAWIRFSDDMSEPPVQGHPLDEDIVDVAGASAALECHGGASRSSSCESLRQYRPGQAGAFTVDSGSDSSFSTDADESFDPRAHEAVEGLQLLD